MKIKILGCGSSTGVPVVGCKCSVCTSGDIKNYRTRSSIYVETEKSNILVDTSPDLRHQLLKNNINLVKTIFYTHAHADHINGIDDVRALNEIINSAIPAYADNDTMEYLKKTFAFVFQDNVADKGWYKPWLKSNIINYYDELQIDDVSVKTIKLGHGRINIAGYRFNDFSYTTDVNFLEEDALNVINGSKVWVVNCLRYGPAVSHANLEQVLKWVKQINVDRVILTHMAHDIDYNEIKSMLPDNVEAAYDGMEIIIK
jgi:phosphoribosyl 1,2-cyclic phosphate phosphodiesterase